MNRGGFLKYVHLSNVRLENIFSPQNNMNEFFNYENVLKSSDDDFVVKDLKPTEDEDLSSNQTFRLIEDHLSYDPSKNTLSKSDHCLFQKDSFDNNQTLDLNLITSCNLPSNSGLSTSNSVYKRNDSKPQISISSPQHCIDATPQPNSKEDMHQIESVMVR